MVPGNYRSDIFSKTSVPRRCLELVKTALCLCDRAHLRTHSYTCDGTNTNWASLKTLGYLNAFDPENIQFELKYEYNNVEKTVCFTPDGCHAVKLARNALGKYLYLLLSFILSGVFIKFIHLRILLIYFYFSRGGY